MGNHWAGVWNEEVGRWSTLLRAAWTLPEGRLQFLNVELVQKKLTRMAEGKGNVFKKRG